jgi:hypothetical protein
MTTSVFYVIVMCILISTLQCANALSTVPSDSEGATNDKTKDWCFSMKERYEIIPGQSFGNLPRSYHNQFLSSKCDQYFCKPHKGIGKFKCEPLG